MKLIWHIIRKDFRHLRLYLAGWLGLLIVAPGLAQLGQRIDFYWIGLLGLLKIVLLALIVSKLVQSDSPASGTSFWLSRPISGRRLLAAKSFFVAGTLIFPALLVEVLFLLVNGATALDVFRSIPQTLFYSLLAVAVLMVLAALTHGLSQMVALGLVFLVVTFLFEVVVVETFGPGNRLDMDPLGRMTLERSKWISSSLCLLAASVIVVCLQYLKRPTRLGYILILSAVLPCILIDKLLTWDMIATVRRPVRTIVDPEHFTARIDEQSLRFYQEGPTSSRNRQMVLQGFVEVGNHPPDLMVTPTQVVSTLSFGSGIYGYERDVNEYEERQLRLSDRILFNWQLDDGRIEILEEVLGGVRLLVSEFRLEPGYVPKFLEIPQEDYERKLAGGGTLLVDVDFLVYKIEVAPLAMETGARYRRGSDQAEVIEVTTAGENIASISLVESHHRLLSDLPKGRWYVLRNRSRGEALLGAEHNSNDFGAVGFIFPTLRVNHLQLKFYPPSPFPPSRDSVFGPDWFEDAELFRIDITTLGTFSKSVRLENLVLRDIPGP